MSQLTRSEALDLLNQQLGSLRFQNNRIKILEAGCGSITKIDIPTNAQITGIDISCKQLQRNTNLQNRILGDIQVHPLQNSYFDLIICWDVLEHLPNPQKALVNFANAVKNNGYIVLKFPNVLSTKGIITKYTPHWFHVFFYRYIKGIKNAGKEDKAPFPTFLDYSISPPAISRFASQNNLSIEYSIHYQDSVIGNMIKKKKTLHLFAFSIVSRAIKAISLNKAGVRESEFAIILKKVKA